MPRIISLAAGALAGLTACGVVQTTGDAAPPDRTADARPIDAPAAPPDAKLVTSYDAQGMWVCAADVDCEDVYDLDFPTSTTVTAHISNVQNGAAPRLGLFAGNLPVGTDLFTGDDTDLCGYQDQDLSGGPLTIQAGHYVLTAGWDWGSSMNSSGTYQLDVAAADPFVAAGLVADDQPSNQADCPE